MATLQGTSLIVAGASNQVRPFFFAIFELAQCRVDRRKSPCHANSFPS